MIWISQNSELKKYILINNRNEEGNYELFGAAGAAAEGAEEEDRDGAGEEDAGGDLEGRGFVGGCEDWFGRREEFHRTLLRLFLRCTPGGGGGGGFGGGLGSPWLVAGSGSREVKSEVVGSVGGEEVEGRREKMGVMRMRREREREVGGQDVLMGLQHL